jgi:hypothetical protein
MIKDNIFDKMSSSNNFNISIIKGNFVEDKNIFTKMQIYCVIEIGQ